MKIAVEAAIVRPGARPVRREVPDSSPPDPETRVLHKLTAAWLAAGRGGAAHGAAKIPVDLALTQATLIHVAAGTRAVAAPALRGDTIVAVVEDAALKRYAPRQLIKLPGKYLMPGLWDTHVHFGGGEALVEENKQLLPLYLAHGITTVRDCAGDLSDTVLAWRQQIAEGKLAGPTIFASGPKLEGLKPMWKGTLEVGSPEEVGKALDKLQAQRVDFVKITENTMTPATYLAALRQAKARSMRTSAHLPGQIPLAQAVEAGAGHGRAPGLPAARFHAARSRAGGAGRRRQADKPRGDGAEPGKL